MKKKESIEIPAKAKQGMQNFYAQKQMVDAQFQIYVKGCFDAMGLDGDWDLDTTLWVLNKRQPPPQPEEAR